MGQLLRVLSCSMPPVPNTRCCCSRQIHERLTHRLPCESPGLALTMLRHRVTRAWQHSGFQSRPRPPHATAHMSRVLIEGYPPRGRLLGHRLNKSRSSNKPSEIPTFSTRGVSHSCYRLAVGRGPHHCGPSGASHADEGEDIWDIPDTLPEMSEGLTLAMERAHAGGPAQPLPLRAQKGGGKWQ